MKQKEFKNLDLELYSETLENGLQVFIVPTPNLNNIYVTFSTNYGSIQNEFIPIGEKKMIKVPFGIAHFLEHKLFEQEDGSEPMNFFAERGASVNANTSHFKTTYLFTGTDFFEENLNYLLDFVQSPYFTDENVEKEKGIIEQEIKMYLDNPYSKLFEKIVYNSFVKHPMKYNVIGTIDSINKITKEILYKCYNTFYNPSNMFIVITGNVKPLEAIRVIKENQKDKKFKEENKILIKQYNEPDKVAKEKEEIEMNIAIPKVAISYKINLDNIKVINLIKKKLYLSIIFGLNFGPTSLFNEQLKQDNIISMDLESENFGKDNFILQIISAETKNPDLLVKKIKKQVEEMDITEEELERAKKSLISSYVYMGDNIYSINNKIMSDLIKYNEVITNNCDEIRTLNLKEAKAVLKSLKLDNNSVFIIKPKK